MQPPTLDEKTALRAAQEWARELPSASYVRRREFVRWIRYSPEHLKAFLALTALETELTGVKDATPFDLESALSRLTAPVATLPSRSNSFSSIPRSERTPAPGIYRARALGMAAFAAAGVAVLILGVWLINRPPAPANTNYAELATDIGQRRSYVLPDGTFIQLNTNSVMRMNYDFEQRNMTLFRGEAWIRVAGDSHRPFAIDVGSVRINDVGTEFTVRAEPNETAVFVIGGRVRLTLNGTQATEGLRAIELGRNEAAVIDTNGGRDPQLHSLRTLTASDTEKKLAWTTGKLVLTGEPLSEVVREINRYHRQQLVIADAELGQMNVGGTIDPATNDYRIIVRALGSGCPIAFDDSNPAVVRLKIDRTDGVCNDRRDDPSSRN